MSVYTFAAIEHRTKLFEVEANNYDEALKIAEDNVAYVDMDRNMDDYSLDVEFESGPKD